MLTDSFDLTPKEAIALQERLRARVILDDRLPAIRRVAGVDLSHRLYSRTVHAAVVVLSFPELQTIEVSTRTVEIEFPYIPGLLAFREIPPIVAAMGGLATPPDLVVVDGHGLAHPRRFGIACHLGVHLDIPSIGCAKNPLVGTVQGDLEPEVGRTAPLVDGPDVIGAALLSRLGSRPIYVSSGHRVSLPTAVALVRRMLCGFRMPAPTREAHRFANLTRREYEERQRHG